MNDKEIFKNLKDLSDLKKDYGKVLANLHYTHFSLMDAYRKILKPYDMSFPQSHVLSIINFYHPREVSLQEIKSMVLEPNSDVSRTVDRLVEKHLVKKVKKSENRRMRSIMMTPAGLKVIKLMEKDSKFHQLLSGLTLADVREFVGVLEKFRDNKDKIVPQ
jgi:DNA-binding MarR family transcriptional regulator